MNKSRWAVRVAGMALAVGFLLLAGVAAAGRALPPPVGVTARVSVNFAGDSANNISAWPGISGDGRYVAYVSWATNLVAGDTNQAYDIFVREIKANRTTRVSVDSAGNQANASSDTASPALSADGRYVAFGAWAMNLAPSEGVSVTEHIYVHDQTTHATTRESVNSAGVAGNDVSGWPTLSADGRFVAFESLASNLVVSDTNGTKDIFVHDRLTGETTRVSVSSAGAQSNGASSKPAISADGRWVAFVSVATNLVTGDSNDAADVFLHDRQTHTTTRVSVSSTGAQADGSSSWPSVSGNGQRVAFVSVAANLVISDTNGLADVFVRDTQTHQTRRVSVSTTLAQADGPCDWAAIAADGHTVAFMSRARTLTDTDAYDQLDVFVHDLETGETSAVSVNPLGSAGNMKSDHRPAISGDGRYVAFESWATDLVLPTDPYPLARIFLRDRAPEPATATPTVTVEPSATATRVPTQPPPTETPTATETPFIMCTPPPCAAGEVLYCPGECPGGCGVQCATVTPIVTVPAESARLYLPLMLRSGGRLSP
jgi:Tol biopolymer transport system component